MSANSQTGPSLADFPLLKDQVWITACVPTQAGTAYFEQEEYRDDDPTGYPSPQRRRAPGASTSWRISTVFVLLTIFSMYKLHIL